MRLQQGFATGEKCRAARDPPALGHHGSLCVLDIAAQPVRQRDMFFARATDDV
jgi:hypothetical protein